MHSLNNLARIGHRTYAQQEAAVKNTKNTKDSKSVFCKGYFCYLCLMTK